MGRLQKATYRYRYRTPEGVAVVTYFVDFADFCMRRLGITVPLGKGAKGRKYCGYCRSFLGYDTHGNVPALCLCERARAVYHQQAMYREAQKWKRARASLKEVKRRINRRGRYPLRFLGAGYTRRPILRNLWLR